jgi:hypothetical protein
MHARAEARPDSRLILLGSSGRNAGKTQLATAIIARCAQKTAVYALKVTSVAARGASCPRGGGGCGACALSGDFLLQREMPAGVLPGASIGAKDTQRMLAAGARESWWLRSLRAALDDGYQRFAAGVPPGAVIVAESNSLRRVVSPAFFVMVENAHAAPKASAREVAAAADLVLRFPYPPAALARAVAAAVDATRGIDGAPA